MKKLLMMFIVLFFNTNCNLKADYLFAWGLNDYGQLGNGKNERTILYPIQIGYDSTWVDIQSGERFSMALKSDGTLWAWGQNNFGQLGDGIQIDKFIPSQIGKDSDWLEVSCWTEHALALKKDGTMWAVGSNGAGQLGDGTQIDKWGFINIGKGFKWNKIAAGTSH